MRMNVEIWDTVQPTFVSFCWNSQRRDTAASGDMLFIFTAFQEVQCGYQLKERWP